MTGLRVGSVCEYKGKPYRLALLQTIKGRLVAWAHRLKDGKQHGGRQFSVEDWLALSPVNGAPAQLELPIDAAGAAEEKR